MALLPVVAAPIGAAPGMRQVVWQVAAWELHAIMQLVTIRPTACAAESIAVGRAATEKAIDSITESIVDLT